MYPNSYYDPKAAAQAPPPYPPPPYASQAVGNGPLVSVIALTIPPIAVLPGAVPASPLAASLRSRTGGKHEHRELKARGLDPTIGIVQHHPKGVSVTFLANKIREFLGIARPESPSYPDREEEIANRLMLSNNELYKLLTEKEKVPNHLPNIPHSAMTDFFRMLHLIVAYNIDPR
ncbi:hypothetical protein CJ030_MR5G022580 [Morella rubra]|uniref:Uncharacterized protein n=1 Tax=Morella rubra TaxID=262757 RepID=A0A6A1VIU9_9ROSI|nr:hypothetical protein CJ030_MR5G022580 [Morella rubra]